MFCQAINMQSYTTNLPDRFAKVLSIRRLSKFDLEKYTRVIYKLA